MADANDYLKGGKYWKQDIVATQDTAQTTSTSFVTVVDIAGEALVSSAVLSVGNLTTVEGRLTRDGDIFTEQITGVGGAPELDFIGRFSFNAPDGSIQAPAMYCKTGFKFEVRYVSGTSSNAIGTVNYTTGTMERV
jgi:hypothetical protein